MSELLDNRYRILRTLGSGGFGETFLAEDTKTPSKRRCVIKKLKPKTDDAETWQIIKDRFEREAAILEMLGQESAQIPSLYAYFDENHEFYLVQDWIEGENLCEIVKAKGRFDEKAVREFLLGVLPVLEFVHSQGIIHRDIKPENIMRRVKDEEYILIDFGAVKEVATTILDSGGTPTSSIVIGSPGFMPNEQAAGKPVFASDLYALALTAVYLLTTKRPQAMNDLTTGDIAWRKFAPNVSADLAAVLDKAIEERARDRFLTSREMLTALQPTPKHSQPISAAINQQPQAIVVNRAETVVLERANTNQAVSPHTIKNSIGMEFVKIPAGSFMMGSPESEKGSYDDERPQRRVTISRDFYMSRTLVTQEQWRAVMGNNPSRFKNCAKCPVEQVSWEDAQEFIKKLNARNEGVYRLPTEAEWEYAPALERREHMREI